MSWARLAAGPCPAHEDLAVGMAAELGRPMTAEADSRLRALAAAFTRRSDPRAELDRAAALLLWRLRVRPAGPLLLPDVLAAGGGHPAGVVLALAAAAARAGVALDVVGHGDRVWLAHRDVEALVLDPVRGAVVDGRAFEVDLAWRCAHESALVVLDRVVARAERDGDLVLALSGASLRLALPVERPTQDEHRAAYGRLLARCN